MFAQVVVGGLARTGRAGIVQNVVLNLERHAYRLAELAHERLFFTGRTDGQRSGRSAHPDQAGGFLVDDIQVRRPRHLLPVRLVVLQNLSSQSVAMAPQT